MIELQSKQFDYTLPHKDAVEFSGIVVRRLHKIVHHISLWAFFKSLKGSRRKIRGLQTWIQVQQWPEPSTSS